MLGRDSQPAPDDLAAARAMSDSVFDGFVKPMKLDRGVPSLVIASTLGALAGHASQIAALKGVAANDTNYAGLSLVSVETATGEQLLFGDAVNRPVLESPYSVWALVAGICQKMGIPVPDVAELAGHVAATLPSGSPWLPRDLPAGSQTPRSALRMWMVGEAVSKDVPHPDHVPVVFALAYQRLAQTDNAVDPSVDQAAMARVMMESTIAMSKVKASPEELGAR